jgi:hypothetical protein
MTQSLAFGLDALCRLLSLAGTVSAIYAVVCERRMQRHRNPGVTYWDATLRRDGGWRRSDLFSPEGLRMQRLASRYGITAAALWLAALVVLLFAMRA